MGGIAFTLAATFVSALFLRNKEYKTVVCIAVGLAYAAVGFLDDFLKKKHKQNLGLSALQKLGFQIAVAIFAGIFCVRIGATSIRLPFVDKSINIGWWILPFAVFVFVATVNAVNLTDGLDGLAASASVPFFSVLGVLITLQEGGRGLPLLCFCLTGALLAYLLFNVSPAKMFMGDTGSLALGGFVSSIALFSGNALYILTVGLCFVLSVISVIIQVIYYKATGGKRVFLMAPLHHHFQQKGFSETQVSYAYFLITLLLGVCNLIPVL